jgi:hypothetical protein
MALKQHRSASAITIQVTGYKYRRHLTDTLQELLHHLNRVICVSSLPENLEKHRRALFKVLNGCISSFINLVLDEKVADAHSWRDRFVSSSCETMLGIFCYAEDEREELLGGKTPSRLF